MNQIHAGMRKQSRVSNNRAASINPGILSHEKLVEIHAWLLLDTLEYWLHNLTIAHEHVKVHYNKLVGNH